MIPTTYLRNLLPRLQHYSESLDKREFFIDQPWVVLNDDDKRHQFIFERDGNLIMSQNGAVTYGRWRLVSAGEQLLMDVGPDESILLNHVFLTKGLLIVKADGSSREPMILVNQSVIPDLDLERYLKSLLPQNRAAGPINRSTNAQPGRQFEDPAPALPSNGEYKRPGEKHIIG